MRQRIELETALLAPRFQAADIPVAIQATLGVPVRAWTPAGDAPTAPATSPGPPSLPPRTTQRQTLDRALQTYMAHIRSDNAAQHIENKVSILRRFLGDEQVAAVLGFKKTRGKPAGDAFFKGELLDELTPTLLQEFMEGLPVSTKTKRHYREFFHHFFEFSPKFGYFQPTNWHYPNPVTALPSYVKKNRHIVFLTAEQVEKQLQVLEPHPVMHRTVAVMIFAGLRRAETLWLASSSIAPDRSYLSVANRLDDDEDIESSLKTGARAASTKSPWLIFAANRTISPVLRASKSEGTWCWLARRGPPSRWKCASTCGRRNASNRPRPRCAG